MPTTLHIEGSVVFITSKLHLFSTLEPPSSKHCKGHRRNFVGFSMPTAVITGANSGIGNAFARILLQEVICSLSNNLMNLPNTGVYTDRDQGFEVIAMDVEIGAPIIDLGCETSELDVSSPEDIELFKQRVGDRPVDLLLNIAGVMFPHESYTLDKVSLTNFQKTFAVNTFGPLLLTKALLPNVEKSQHPRIAVMSSRVGSIADNSTGGMYSYRSSKTAVNMIFKNLAVDLEDKNIPVILLHPGIVKTNLDQKWKDGGNDDVKGAIEPDDAASDLWNVLNGKGLESTGKFFHGNGEELPW